MKVNNYSHEFVEMANKILNINALKATDLGREDLLSFMDENGLIINLSGSTGDINKDKFSRLVIEWMTEYRDDFTHLVIDYVITDNVYIVKLMCQDEILQYESEPTFFDAIKKLGISSLKHPGSHVPFMYEEGK